jgi:hypothetical protein
MNLDFSDEQKAARDELRRLLLDPDLFEIQQGFFLAPGYRMGGGTEEIGKNIIAERVLGLPPDIRVDKDVPFNSIPRGTS